MLIYLLDIFEAIEWNGKNAWTDKEQEKNFPVRVLVQKLLDDGAIFMGTRIVDGTVESVKKLRHSYAWGDYEFDVAEVPRKRGSLVFRMDDLVLVEGL